MFWKDVPYGYDFESLNITRKWQEDFLLLS